jgi:hypothetical protein
MAGGETVHKRNSEEFTVDALIERNKWIGEAETGPTCDCCDVSGFLGFQKAQAK